MNNQLKICKNAKFEEIKAYKILKSVLFYDKITVVGDDAEKFLPDIYTEDFSIGAEVTSCEHLSQFLKETYKNLGRKNEKFDKNAKFLMNGYDNLSLKDKNILFNEEFEKVLEKKIKKIKNYKKCQSINLIIVSDNELKPFIRRETLSKIYKNLVEKYKVKYDHLFLVYNNCLYVDINYNFIKLKKIKEEDLTK